MGDSDNNDEDTSPSAEQGGKVVVTDLLGLGAAAKSPAGKEIGKAIGKLVSVVTDPTRSLLMGLAKTKVDTKRITEIAKAEAQARQVDVANRQSWIEDAPSQHRRLTPAVSGALTRRTVLVVLAPPTSLLKKGS